MRIRGVIVHHGFWGMGRMSEREIDMNYSLLGLQEKGMT